MMPAEVSASRYLYTFFASYCDDSNVHSRPSPNARSLICTEHIMRWVLQLQMFRRHEN